MAAVNVVVKDDAPQPAPVSGVTVSAFVPDALVLAGQGVTDENGVAAFSLPSGTYELRMFKLGLLFSNPFAVPVVEDGFVNEFDVFGTRVGNFGVPNDARLCRCVGRFLNYQNQPAADAMVRISSPIDLLEKNPMVVDGNLIMPSALELRTDSNGYVTVDLLRGGFYWLTFAGEEDEPWNFAVPDRPSVNLIDLIHPYPVSLAWQTEGSSLDVAKNSTLTINFQVTFSDFQTRSTELQDILQFLNSDPDVIDLAYQTTGSLVVTGRAPGAATIRAKTVDDLFPKRVPDYSLQAPLLFVTVNP